MNAENGLVNRLDDLLAVVHANDRDQLVSWLLTHGGAEPATIGASMFEAAQQAMAVEDFVAARVILHHLLEVTADEQSRERLSQFIGDLYLAEGRGQEARDCYHQGICSEKGLVRYLYTFVQDNDLRGLFFERDRLIGVTHDHRLRNYLEEVVSQCVGRIMHQSQIGQERLETLRRNLEYLRQIDPPMAERLAGLGELESCAERILSLDGVVYLFQGNKWASQRGERPAKERLSRAGLEVTDPQYGVLVRCSCLGSFLELIAALRTDDPEYYKYQLLILIDSRLLASFLAVADLAPLISCDFIIRFLDERGMEQHLPEVMLNNNVLTPSKFMYPLPEDERFLRERVFPLFKAVKDEAGKKIARYAKGLTERYPAGFSRTIPGKVRDKSLRVLLLVSRYTTFLQYCMRDLAAGLRELGYETEIMIEKEHEPPRWRYDIQMQRFCEFLPDIIICINHFRYEIPWIPKEIPFVTWIQDWMENIFEIDDPSLLGDQDYLYCTSVKRKEFLEVSPAFRHKTVQLLTYLLNPDYYHPLDGMPKKYEVSYVAHQEVPEPYAKALSTLPDSALTPDERLHREFLLYTEQLSLRELNRCYTGSDQLREEFFRNFTAARGIPYKTPSPAALYYFRHKLLYIVIRSRPIKRLLDHGIPVALFGNGWDHHPWFRKYAMGPVSNGEELNKVINQTKINLNINPFMSCHNKVPEVAGAGGFFLSRNIGEDDLMPLGGFFEVGREVILFEDEDDLVEKVRYYLKNEGEREKVARRCHERVLKEYTFSRGAARILHDIVTNLS